MKLKLAVNINDRIFVGTLSIEESGIDEVVVDGDAKFLCERKRDLGGDRIWDDYVALSWEE